MDAGTKKTKESVSKRMERKEGVLPQILQLESVPEGRMAGLLVNTLHKIQSDLNRVIASLQNILLHRTLSRQVKFWPLLGLL